MKGIISTLLAIFMILPILVSCKASVNTNLDIPTFTGTSSETETISDIADSDSVDSSVESSTETEVYSTEYGADNTMKITVYDSQLYSGNLILINESHRKNSVCIDEYILISTSYDRPKSEKGTNIYTVGNTVKFKATSESTSALNAMLCDFYKQIKDDNIIIANAYYDGIDSTVEFASGSSFELKYFVDYKNDPTAKAGINGVAKYSWIYENAYKYGFIINDNTFRYVGVVHSMAMKEKSFQSLEAYLEYLENNTTLNNPLRVTLSNAEFLVYYVSKESNLYVPKDASYIVSGNNVNGYIITVE